MKAITAENISKLYIIGAAKSGNLRETVASRLQSVKNVFLKNKVKNEETRFFALKDINFTVDKGESVGIVGRNGAGKSTLLKILSRITLPTTGQITINGKVSSLLEVGTGFHPELTGRENIFLNGTILGMRRSEVKRRFEEIVEFSGISKFIDTPVKRYSSGMYVRLAFSVAAHLEPEILIVDEVLAVGDAAFQKKCLGKMDEVTKGGRTVLFVSHNMGAVSSLCKRGIFLDQGKIIEMGHVDSVIEKYIEFNSESRGVVTWDANVNADAVMIKARLLCNGSETAEIPINKSFQLEIHFQVNEDNLHLNPCFQLFSSIGEKVLSSADWPSATVTNTSYNNSIYNKGVYKTIVTFPENFFNDKAYYLNLFLLKNVNQRVDQKDAALSFMIIDTGEMTKEYTGPWFGMVRPKLDWNTTKIE